MIPVFVSQNISLLSDPPPPDTKILFLRELQSKAFTTPVWPYILWRS